jgi:hypothetical protein
MATRKIQEPIPRPPGPTPTTPIVGLPSDAYKAPTGNPVEELEQYAMKVVTEKDVYGNYQTKPRKWFSLQRQAIIDYPRMKEYPEYLSEYSLLMMYGDVGEGTLMTLAEKFGVPISALGAAGAGGGGRSREQRQNTINSLSARLQNESAKLGIKLSNDQIAYMATAAEKLDFTEDQLTDMIVNQIDWTKIEQGTLTASRDQIKAMGKKYLMNLSDTTAQDYSKRIASGELDTNAISNILAAQARSSMPWIAQYLDQGLTPEDVLTPSRDAIAQGLEITAGDVDITDAKYLKMMTVDDAKSGTRLATQSEVQKNVRTDSRWGQTKQAKQLGSSMATTIAQIFGRSSF